MGVVVTDADLRAEVALLESELASITLTPGPQGPVGPTGPTGKSAYQVWLDAGHTGSMSDFLTSLIGAAGATGATGAAGTAGQRGSRFLGAYPTTASLPVADNVSVFQGDFAYVTATGELWQLQ